MPALVLLLSGPLLATACGWGDRHVEARVGAVRQAEAMGVVNSEVNSDFTESDVAVTTRYMVLDLGVPRSEEALRKGADRLRAGVWRVEVDRFPGSIYLISDRLGTSVLLEPLEKAFATIVKEEVKKAAEDARAKIDDPGSLFFMSLQALRS